MESSRKNKIHLHWGTAFAICYIGGYGVLHITNHISPNYMLIQILALSACSFLCVYGWIALVDDYKNGGLAKIIKRIKGMLNGRS